MTDKDISGACNTNQLELAHTQNVKGEYCYFVIDHCIDHKTSESRSKYIYKITTRRSSGVSYKLRYMNTIKLETRVYWCSSILLQYTRLHGECAAAAEDVYCSMTLVIKLGIFRGSVKFYSQFSVMFMISNYQMTDCYFLPCILTI